MDEETIKRVMQTQITNGLNKQTLKAMPMYSKLSAFDFERIYSKVSKKRSEKIQKERKKKESIYGKHFSVRLPIGYYEFMISMIPESLPTRKDKSWFYREIFNLGLKEKARRLKRTFPEEQKPEVLEEELDEEQKKELKQVEKWEQEK